MKIGDGAYRALLVGNSQFPEDPNQLEQLVGPPYDVQALHAALSDPVCGLFDTSNIRNLVEGTRNDVERALEEAANTAGEGDTLFVFYSGHGILDAQGRFYIAARDTTLQRLVSTAISADTINAILTSGYARNVILALDCCHSGAYSFKGGAIPETLRGKGYHLLASASRQQLARDTLGGEPKPSLFTGILAGGLTSTVVDTNRDGFVTLHEIYLYTQEQLSQYKQTPLYQPGKQSEVAISRSPVRPVQTEDAPILQVDPENIDLRDVRYGELLSPEVISVFNAGGGQLDWEARCDSPWVKIKLHSDRIVATLSPVEGMNRAIISVRDRGRGGAKTVRLTVIVSPTGVRQAPRLIVPTTRVDLGVSSIGGEPPRRTITVENGGDGDLAPSISHMPDGVDAIFYGNDLSIQLDTSVSRHFDDVIRITSAGGAADVRVVGVVQSGPVLTLSEELVDFGTTPVAKLAERTVTVSNTGAGDLQWAVEPIGDIRPFGVRTTGADSFVVTCTPTGGTHSAQVRVRGNGGDVTLQLRASGRAAGMSHKGKVLAASAAAIVLAGAIGIGVALGNGSNTPKALPLETTAPEATTPATEPPSTGPAVILPVDVKPVVTDPPPTTTAPSPIVLPSASQLLAGFAPGDWSLVGDQASSDAFTCYGSYTRFAFDGYAREYQSQATDAGATAFVMVFDGTSEAADYEQTLISPTPDCAVDLAYGQYTFKGVEHDPNGSTFIYYTLVLTDGSTRYGTERVVQAGPFVMDANCDSTTDNYLSAECNDLFGAMAIYIDAQLGL